MVSFLKIVIFDRGLMSRIFVCQFELVGVLLFFFSVQIQKHPLDVSGVFLIGDIDRLLGEQKKNINE